MVTSLLQKRVHDSLKEEAARVFDNLGIDTSAAVRMILKRSVMEKGSSLLPEPWIPDQTHQNRRPDSADRIYIAPGSGNPIFL